MHGTWTFQILRTAGFRSYPVSFGILRQPPFLAERPSLLCEVRDLGHTACCPPPDATCFYRCEIQRPESGTDGARKFYLHPSRVQTIFFYSTRKGTRDFDGDHSPEWEGKGKEETDLLFIHFIKITLKAGLSVTLVSDLCALCPWLGEVWREWVLTFRGRMRCKTWSCSD